MPAEDVARIVMSIIGGLSIDELTGLVARAQAPAAR
jgi:hypothetical protein